SKKRSAAARICWRKVTVEPDMSSSITRLNGAWVGSKLRIGRRTPSSYTTKSFCERLMIEWPCLSTTPTFSWTRAVSVVTTSSWAWATGPTNERAIKNRTAGKNSRTGEAGAGTRKLNIRFTNQGLLGWFEYACPVGVLQQTVSDWLL